MYLKETFCVKGTWILFKFLFLMQKSILDAKIAVSQIYFFFQNMFLNIRGVRDSTERPKIRRLRR